ncbi:MAG: autotransporter-associated beta strand repeat-containing protein, partial [Verrucomicrobiota bacterium]
MLLFILLSPAKSAAAIYIWDGGSNADSFWSTAENWYPDGAPANSGTALIQLTGTERLSAVIDTFWSVRGLAFTSSPGANSFTLSGNTLSIQSGGITQSDDSAQTISNDLVLGAAQTFSASSGNLTLSGNISNGGNALTVTPGSGQTLTISGILSGSGALQMNGTGRVVLSGANSYTGNTTISSGTVTVQHSQGLGTHLNVSTSTSVFSGGTLELENNITIASETFSLSGSGSGSGAILNVSGNNTLAGTISVGGSGATIGSTSGLLTLSGNIGNGGQPLTFAGAGNISASGVISSFGNLIKNGAGTLTLTGNSTMSGTTTVNDGILVLSGSSGALASSISFTVNGPGTLTLLNGSGNNGNRISNSAGVTLAGGTFNFSNNGSSTLNFSETVAGLTLSSGASTVTSGQAGVGKSSTMTFASLTRSAASGGTVNFTGTELGLDSRNTIAFTSAPTLDDGIIGGWATSGNEFAKYDGTVGSATPLVTGDYNIDSETGWLSSSNAKPSVSQSLTASRTINSLNLGDGINIDAGGMTLQIDSGGLLKSGAGDSAISHGTLQPGSLSAERELIVHVESGRNLHFGSATEGQELTLADNTAAAVLTKSGAGTLVLLNANSYTGATFINQGALQVRHASGLGTTDNGVTVQTGGALELQGGISIGAESLTLNSTGISSGGALRNVSGDNTFGGAITLNSASRINSDAGTLTLSGSIAGAYAVTFGGSGHVLVSGSFSNSGTSVTKDGSGMLTLSGANNFTQTLLINDGTVALGASHTLLNPPVTIDGASAILDISAFSDTVGAVTLRGGGTITGTSGTLTGTSYSVESGTVSAILGGAVALTKSTAGTVTLTKANSYTGVTTINAGTLELGADNVIATGGLSVDGSSAVLSLGSFSDSVGLVYVRNGASITGSGTLTSTSGFSLESGTVSAILGGASGIPVSKSTSATVTLTGANSYSGNTLVGDGTLLLSGSNGSVANSSAFTVTGPGILQLSNSSVANNANRMGSVQLTLSGGTFYFSNDGSSADFSETIGQLLLSVGANTVEIDSAALGQTSTLTFSSLSRSAANGATVNFTGSNLGSSRNLIAFTSSPNLDHGILGGWAVVDTEFAKYADGSVLALSAGDYATGSESSWASTQNAKPSASQALTAGRIINSLNLSSGVGVDLGDFTLQIDTGGVIKSGSSASVISNGTLQPGSQSSERELIFHVDSDRTLTLGSSTAGQELIIPDNGGATTILKSGAGRLELLNSSTYTGNTAVNQGMLRIADSSGLGSTTGATRVQYGAALELQGGIAVGSETLTLNGTGVSLDGALRNISGNNSWSGSVTLGSATLISSDAGTLTLSGAISGSGIGLSLGGAGDLAFSGIIGTGSGTITKQGDGQAVLSGANTFTGAITINSGTLNLQHNTGAGTMAGGIVVIHGATLALESNSSLAIGAEALTLSGPGVNNGGALRNISGANSYAGALVLNAPARIHSDAGTLTLSGGLSGAYALTFGGAGDISITGSIANSGGGVTKEGSGTLTYNVANTYTGTTTVNAGTIAYGVANALSTGAVVVDGATALFNLNGFNDSVGSVTLRNGGTITSSSGILTGSSFSFENGTVSAPLAGSGALTKSTSGTVTLSGANTFSGSTTISSAGGTLLLTGANGAIASSSSISVASQGALTLNNTAAANNGNRVGAVTLTLSGGTLNFQHDSGAANFSETIGGLTINVGAAGLNASQAAESQTSTLTFSSLTRNSGNGGTLHFTGTGLGLDTRNQIVFTSSPTLDDGIIGGWATVGTEFAKYANGSVTALEDGDYNTGTQDTWTSLGNVKPAASATLSANRGVNSLNLTDGIQVDLGDFALTIDTGGLMKSGATSSVISNGTLRPGSAVSQRELITYVDSGRTLTLGSTTAGQDLTIPDNGGSTILTKSGPGTLEILNANTYSGATYVNEGVVNIRNGSALGSNTAGTIVQAGAALEMQNGISVGAKSLTLNSTGISDGGALRNISGNNSWAGNLSITSASRINSDSGTLTLSGSVTASAATSGITVGGAGNITMSGVVGGSSFPLTKDGSGTLTLIGANTFSGAVTVSAGVLNLQNSAASGTTAGGISVSSGAALELQHGSGLTIGSEFLTLNGTGIANGGALRSVSGDNTYQGQISLGLTSRINTDADSLTISGLIFGPAYNLHIGGAGDTTLSGVIEITGGSLTKDGAGTVTLSGANLYSGGTTINDGVLSISNDANLGRSGGITLGGGTLRFTSAFTSARAITLTDDSTFDNSSGGTATLTGGLDKAGSNITFTGNGATTVIAGTGIFGAADVFVDGTTVQYDSAQTYNGPTYIRNSGTLRLGASNVMPTAPASALLIDGSGTSTFDLNNYNATIASLSSALSTAQVQLGTATLTLGDSSSTTFAGVISGAGAIVKQGSGTLILSGANTFSGGITLSDGTLESQHATGLGAGNIALNNGNLIISTTSQSSAQTLSVNGNNPGQLTIDSGVTFTLGDAANDLTGSSNLLVDGGGTLALDYSNNYSGQLTISGSATVRAGAAGAIGTGPMRLNGGTLSVVTVDQTYGETFSIFNSGNTIHVNTGRTFTLGDEANDLTSTGSFTKTGQGTLSLGYANDYSGTMTITAGTVVSSVQDALGSGNIILNGGTLSITGVDQEYTQTFTANAATTSTIHVDEDLGFQLGDAADALTGSGNLVKTGAGDLFFLNANSNFSGQWQVDEGFIGSGKSEGIGTGAVVLNGGGFAAGFEDQTYSQTFTVNADSAFDMQSSFTLTIGTAPDALIGTGLLANQGGGAVALNFANSNFTGGWSLDSGTLISAAQDAIGTGNVLLNGGTLAFTTVDQTYNQTFTAGASTSSTLDVAASRTVTLGNAANDLTGSGSVSKSGAGILRLSNANDFSGNWELEAGTLSARAAGALGTGNVTLNGATLHIDLADQTYNQNFNVASASTIDVESGYTLTLGNEANDLNGVSALTKAGAGKLVLTQSSSLSGGISLASGTLSIGHNNALGPGTLTLSGSASIESHGGSRSAANNIALNSALTVDGANDLTLSGVITGSAGLTKQGAGTLTLSGNNVDLSGTVTLTSGTLAFGHNSGAGTGTLVINGGAIQASGADRTLGNAVTAGADFTISGSAALTLGTVTLTGDRSITVNNTSSVSQFVESGGARSLTKDGSGTLNVTATSTYSGATVVNAGTLAVQGSLGSTSGFTINGGTLSAEKVGALGSANVSLNGGTLSVSAFDQTYNQTFTASSASTLHVDAIDFTLGNAANDLTGAADLTKTGNGYLLLFYSNDYSGNWNVSGGLLGSATQGATGTGNITLSGGGLGIGFENQTFGQTLNIVSGSRLSIQSAYTFTLGDSDNDVTGAGLLTAEGAGTVRLNFSNNNSGGWAIEDATVISSAQGALGTGNISFTGSGGVLRISDVNQTLNQGVAASVNGGTISVDSGLTLTLGNEANDLTGDSSLTKTGAGTLTLGFSNNYSGGWTLSQGTLESSAQGSFGSGNVTLNGGTILIKSTEQLYSQNFTANTGSTSTIQVDADGSLELSAQTGPLAGSGNLIKNGAGEMLISAGSDNFSGTWQINAGAVYSSASGSMGTGNITLNGGVFGIGLTDQTFTQTFTINSASTLDAANATTFTLGNAADDLTGTGALTKDGTGTLVLNYANSNLTGAWSVLSGTLTSGAQDAFGTGNITITGTDTVLKFTNVDQTYPQTLTVNATSSIEVDSGLTVTLGNGANDITGGFQLTKTGTGTLVLSFASNHSGGWALAQGTLNSAAQGALGAGDISLEGGTLSITASDQSAAQVVTANSASTIQVANGVTFTLGDGANDLTGAGALTKTGAGRLELEASSNHSGGIQLDAGTLALGHNSAAGTGVLTLNGGAVEAANGDRTIDNTVTLAGNVSFGGNDALVLSGATTLTGDRTLTVNNTTTFSGVIGESGGARSLTKAGSGTLIISGANSYSGSTTVSAGTLQLGASGSIPNGSAVSVSGTLDLNDFNETIASLSGNGAVDLGSAFLTMGNNSDTTFSGAISGTGGLIKQGSGALTLSGTSTFTGSTTINAGTIELASDAALGAAPGLATANQLIINDATLRATETFTLHANRGATFTGFGATIEVTSGKSLTAAQVISGTGNLYKQGPGTLILSGNNTFTGLTIVNQGTVQVDSDSRFGTAPGNPVSNQLVLDGGTLAVTESFTSHANRGISVDSNGGTIDVGNGKTLTIAGFLSGAGTLTKSGNGTLALNQLSDYSGGTILNSGTLVIGHASGPGTGTLTVNGGTLEAGGSDRTLANNITVGGDFSVGGSYALSVSGTTTLTGNRTATIDSTLATWGVISETGGPRDLTKAGSGTLTVSGTSTYSGSTILNAGSLRVTGNISSSSGVTINGGTLT